MESFCVVASLQKTITFNAFSENSFVCILTPDKRFRVKLSGRRRQLFRSLWIWICLTHAGISVELVFVTLSTKRDCNDDFGLTWLPHSKYSQAYWVWIRTCFFFLSLDAALEDTLTRYSKVKVITGGEDRPFRSGSWNATISFRHP